jgi:glucokinase
MKSNKKILGIDLGGTKIHAALYDSESLEQLKEEKLPTDAQRGIKAVLEDIAALINRMADEETVGAGMGIPGYVNSNSGILYKTPNIPQDEPEINLREFFKDRIKLPIVFDNDANLFTYAEYKMNRTDEPYCMLGLTLGTGLGGGIVIKGEIFRGSKGLAAEVGWIAFTEDKYLEDLVSGKGKDETRGKYLGITIADLVNIFNPEVIAIGGAIAEHFETMKEDMWTEIKKRAVPESYKDLEIYESKLEDPGTLGAALLALKEIVNA